jgi:hypothetical protein
MQVEAERSDKVVTTGVPGARLVISDTGAAAREAE